MVLRRLGCEVRIGFTHRLHDEADSGVAMLGVHLSDGVAAHGPRHLVALQQFRISLLRQDDCALLFDYC
ncbi:unnamed protein product [Toxocara canis]|uniref:Transcriptional regulator n=1 Tax=Toxocara canis TaxID=6265 RepID=A0A183TV21_TOXCA|nr:unnamed protein product [Toxocara canis]